MARSAGARPRRRSPATASFRHARAGPPRRAARGTPARSPSRADSGRLRLLLERSRRGSMRAVADELGYTTSTVSQQLGVLAREAATPLIEPAGRMVRLTPAGQRLADHAVTILAALEAARADLDP